MLALTYCFSLLREGGGPSKIEVRISQVGSMLALFSHFFALGRLLRGSGAFFAHVGRFFRVSGRSGSNFGASRHNFGGSETSFFDVWAHAQVCNARQLLMRKNHSFS